MKARIEHTVATALIDVRLARVQRAALDVNLYQFEPVNEHSLPPATAGSHIDLHLPNGLIRQYSLVMGEYPTDVFTIAVKRDAASRGGSSYIHNELRVGTTLKVSAPRNNFMLDESARHSVLIAGGIGITPIYSMINRLNQLSRSWELHFACRSRAEMAFLSALTTLPQAKLHFDNECCGTHLDIERIIKNSSHGAHFYCCGPRPMLATFVDITANLPFNRKHVEYFTPREKSQLQGGFVVRLAKSGIVLTVPEGRSILEVVKEAGVAVEHSCAEGICGTCETSVIWGIPEHRDSILSDAERAANKTIFICCSGSKTDELVLAL